MSATVVIADHNHVDLEAAATAIRDAGYDVATFDDSMAALIAVEQAETVRVLVTRLNFPQGKPNGLSIASMLWAKRPSLKVIFIARADMAEFTGGIGELLTRPVDLPKLVEAVRRLAGLPSKHRNSAIY
jgi:DNA-binding NtrC family response regulator